MEGVWASRLVQRQVADARHPVLVNRHDRSGFELARVGVEGAGDQRSLFCRFVHAVHAQLHKRRRTLSRVRKQGGEIRIPGNDHPLPRCSRFQDGRVCSCLKSHVPDVDHVPSQGRQLLRQPGRKRIVDQEL